MNAIPGEIAGRLCQQIREENRGRWYNPGRWQCWGCVKFSKGDVKKMCLSNREDNRGCNLVNTRYDKIS